MKRLLIIAALVFSAPAAAQNFYIGAALGETKAKDSCDGAGLVGVTCDDTDTAWRVFGGYQFHRHLALEVGYIDLGEVRASGPGGTLSAEASAVELVGVGLLPIAERFAVFGKFGLYRGETDAKINTSLLTGSFSETNTDLTFGFGVRFDFTKNAGAFVQWQRYSDVGGGDIGEDDVDVMSGGALFRF